MLVQNTVRQAVHDGAGIKVNRAPVSVLTLWAAVVAERLGHPPNLALTPGHAVAGSSAHGIGIGIGIAEDRDRKAEQTAAYGRCGRVPFTSE